MGSGGKTGVHSPHGCFRTRQEPVRYFCPPLTSVAKNTEPDRAARTVSAECTRDLGLYADKLDVSQPEQIDPRALLASGMKLIRSVRSQRR